MAYLLMLDFETKQGKNIFCLLYILPDNNVTETDGRSCQECKRTFIHQVLIEYSEVRIIENVRKLVKQDWQA